MEQRGQVAITRKDMEQKLAVVGDYVKMDYLQQCLKKQLDFDTRKFALLTLATIYETRGMHLEAARLLRNAAEINTTYEGKMQDFMRSTGEFIKGSSYDEAHLSCMKALGCVAEKSKSSVKEAYKKLYFTHAEELIKKDKRKHALEAYERILSLDMLTPEEKRKAQVAALPLYEKLGKVKEFLALKKQL